MKPFFNNKTNRSGLILIAAMMLFNVWNVIMNTPMVPEQHWAQKIFYVHVPSAWVGFLSYFIVMVAGILFFMKKDDYWDVVGLAAAEIGTVFMSLVLITGPIWAKPIWGKPWIWEPRLTTTLILFLIYIGYFMMRTFGGHIERVKRYAAAVGIIAFVDVPIWNSSSPASQYNNPWFEVPLLKNIPESSESAVELPLLTSINWSSIDIVAVFNSVLVPSTTKSPTTLVVFESRNTVFEPPAPVPVLIV